MEIVCPAWYPGADRLVDAIPILSNQGVTAIEIGMYYPEYFDQRDPVELEMLISRLGSWGIRVHSLHCSVRPYCDISSPDDEVHERGVVSLIDAMEFARVVDASLVILHASDKFDRRQTKAMDRARGVIREMSTVAHESGGCLPSKISPRDIWATHRRSSRT